MQSGFCSFSIFFFQAEDGIRDVAVTGVQTCALPISERRPSASSTPTAAHRRRRRSRRETPGATPDSWFTSRRVLDGRADARIGATAANVARHRLVDIAVGGRRVLRQQRGGGHDLAGLAVAALHDLEVEPRLLDPLADGCGADALDGGDGMADRGAHRRDARSSWYAVEVHGAGAAQCGAAAELGASHAEQVPQDPKQGHVGWRIDGVTSAVDCQCDHGFSSMVVFAPPGPSSRPIHSRMYGAQCTSATPSDSQATRKRTTATSTSVTSSRSNTRRGRSLRTWASSSPKFPDSRRPMSRSVAVSPSDAVSILRVTGETSSKRRAVTNCFGGGELTSARMPTSRQLPTGRRLRRL